MADSKVSQLPVLSAATLAAEDLVLVIDDPNGTPTSKRITIKNFLGNLPSNTSITGTLSVSANTSVGRLTVANSQLTIADKTGVTSNNTTTMFGAGKQGTMVWDDNYLYLATSNTVIKRVALSIFDS
jgi:hypothetical protein